MSGFDYVAKLTESNNQRAEALEKAKEIPEFELQLNKRNSQAKAAFLRTETIL